MIDYTNEEFYQTLHKFLQKKGNKELINFLRGGECKVSTWWDSMGSGNFGEVTFFIHMDKLATITDKNKKDLEEHCLQLLHRTKSPPIKNVWLKFVPLIMNYEVNSEDNELVSEIEKIVSNHDSSLVESILPQDIINKGKEMMEVYFFLFCVENSLRLLIEKIVKNNKLEYDQIIEKKINSRKNKLNKNKWLPVRGDSDLFYLDFSDLIKIISQYWDYFKPFFPDENWILGKLNEMKEIRNYIAHNSIIEQGQKHLLKVYFENIMKQIAEK